MVGAMNPKTTDVEVPSTIHQTITVLMTAFLLAGAVFSQGAYKAKAKSSEKDAKAARIISARVDKTGQHPGTAPVTGPTTITCTNATSDLPRPQPPPSCFIVAPGYSGQLNKNQSAGTSGAGTVTLNCNGQGNLLTCTARLE